jgi:hypothetical protein
MCFFPLFSRPPKRRYSALYSSSDEDLPPRKKRLHRAPDTPHSRYETLRGNGVKRSPLKISNEVPVATVTMSPLRGHGVKRDPPRQKIHREKVQREEVRREEIEREIPKRPAARNSHRRPSQRASARRQTERTASRQRAPPPVAYAPPLYPQSIVPPVDINYHSRYICNTAPRYQRDGYAVRAATNQALRGSVYQEPAPPLRNLRRQPAYGALRYHQVPWQWA